MSDEEKMLRAKFYLAPKETTIEQLRHMNETYTAYPGATKEQAEELYKKLMEFKNSLDSDGVKVIRRK